MKYNSAFFSLLENTYSTLEEQLGKEQALSLFRAIMHKGLEQAYGHAFTFGESQEFVRLVGARDEAVGLAVAFPEVTHDKIIYQFHTDPLPGLKAQLPWEDVVDTYLDFKVQHILGENWHYRTTRHFWWGNNYIEHIIEKRKHDNSTPY